MVLGDLPRSLGYMQAPHSLEDVVALGPLHLWLTAKTLIGQLDTN